MSKLSLLLTLVVSLLVINKSYSQNNVVLIEKESSWKYLDDGSDQGVSWQALDFADDTWQEGHAKLGYGDDNNNTTLSYGPDENNKFITCYFRKTFTIASIPDSVQYHLNILYDDGAVVYINGVEAVRSDMPEGEILYNTLSTGDVGGALETTFHPFEIPGALFQEGENIIAVEIHQAEVTSSDIGFDLEIIQSAYVPVTLKNSVPPLIQNNWQTFMWPYNAYLPLNDNGPNGHEGNNCGYTAVARIIHYWQHVPNGKGVISENYYGTDYYCDLENLDLDYDNMPYELRWEDNESTYTDIATLMKATAAMGAKSRINSIGTEALLIPVLANHFHFKSTAKIAYRGDYSREEWIQLFKSELSAGRPLLIVGRTEDSPAPGESGRVTGHWFICDGYNEQDEFYYNYSYSQIREYADIDNMGIYNSHHYAWIGLEPSRYEINQEVTICEGEEYKGWIESGNYTETYSSVRGVDSIVSTELTVVPLPGKPSITRDENTLSSSADTGNQWYLDGVKIAGATLKTYTVTKTGDYSVEVTNTNGCRAVSDLFAVSEIFTSGVNHRSLGSEIALYPNPVVDVLSVVHEEVAIPMVKVYNSRGIEIFQAAASKIDLSAHPAGIYFVKVISRGNKLTNHKVIKE